MNFDEVHGVVEEFAQVGERRGDYAVSSVALADGLHYWIFRRPQGYSLLKLSRADTPNIDAFLQLAGGGAIDVPADANLCQAIFERHVNIDWGGPFVRSWPNGTMAYGTQMVLPAALLHRDPNAWSFVFGMVDLFGEIARSIAVELVPRFGGEMLDGTGDNHDAEFFGALLGPPPPGIDLAAFGA